jgi:hypothetical protein
MDELNETHRAIRAHVCMECHRRPTGSDMLGPEAARSCEGMCEVFDRLPRLAAMVHRFGGEPPCGYRAAIQSLVCKDCGSDDRARCACDQLPLARYASEILATLESIDRG